MPLPRWIAHANKRFTNRLVEPVVRRFTSYAVIGHVGRMTATPYRTPVSLFGGPEVFYVALTYGPNADWVRNVLANGGTCRKRAGSISNLVDPTLVDRGEAWRHLPRSVRFFLRVLRVRDFMRFNLAGQSPRDPSTISG